VSCVRMVVCSNACCSRALSISRVRMRALSISCVRMRACVRMVVCSNAYRSRALSISRVRMRVSRVNMRACVRIQAKIRERARATE